MQEALTLSQDPSFCTLQLADGAKKAALTRAENLLGLTHEMALVLLAATTPVIHSPEMSAPEIIRIRLFIVFLSRQLVYR